MTPSQIIEKIKGLGGTANLLEPIWLPSGKVGVAFWERTDPVELVFYHEEHGKIFMYSWTPSLFFELLQKTGIDNKMWGDLRFSHHENSFKLTSYFVDGVPKEEYFELDEEDTKRFRSYVRLAQVQLENLETHRLDSESTMEKIQNG